MPDSLKKYIQYLLKVKSLTMVILIVAILAIIIVPLPGPILDFMLAVSISLSVLIMLVSLYVDKPTSLTTFPTIILIITLFRLALNIATTRMILSKGHEGPEAVSDIIASFGQFVVGGNYVIGVIVFCILVLINFMVVTKGATRVSEVKARFALDGMPMKFMAIDADLNAGTIDDAQAKARRAEVEKDSEFYGNMDGSSKFIKGDAVAGIIVTIINIAGGFMIGSFQHGLPLADSAQTYTILTIGDGLVSQIPGLITSTATAIIITRSNNIDKEQDPANNFTNEAVKQLVGGYNILFILSAILFVFALVPGLPFISLGMMALLFFGFGYLMIKTQNPNFSFFKKKDLATGPKVQSQQKASENIISKPQKSDEQIAKEREQKIDSILKPEILELELGFGLLRLADREQGGDLTDRISNIREVVAGKYGFLMPGVRIRDNMQLDVHKYVIKLKGSTVAEAIIYPEKFLALDDGMATDEIEGIPTTDPAFGTAGLWIDAYLKDEATIYGYTVVDAANVLSTHLGEVVKNYAADLLTRQETNNLLEKLKTSYEVLVNDCLNNVGIGTIQRVLQNLLSSKIPIRDMLSILEDITDKSERYGVKDPDELTEFVRTALARVITSLYVDTSDNVFYFYILAQETVSKMLEIMASANNKALPLNVAQTNALINAIKKTKNEHIKNHEMVICVEPTLRPHLDKIISRFNLGCVVLSYTEIAQTFAYETEGTIVVENFN